MIQLFDVNLLISLADANHPHHAAAKAFFPSAMATGWATCPITEGGFMRILSSARYPGGVESPQVARQILNRLREMPGHQFWPDDISLADATRLPHLPSSKHLTDAYLLALAVAHGGRLVTFDQGIDPKWVSEGENALSILPTASS